MRLETEKDGELDATSESDIRLRLASMNRNDNSFAILAQGDESYIQTTVEDEGFTIEKREGRFDRHFAARVGDRRHFTKNDVTEAFVAYFAGRQMPPGVTWANISMPEAGRVREGAHAAVRYLLVILPFAVLAIALAWKWLG